MLETSKISATHCVSTYLEFCLLRSYIQSQLPCCYLRGQKDTAMERMLLFPALVSFGDYDLLYLNWLKSTDSRWSGEKRVRQLPRADGARVTLHGTSTVLKLGDFLLDHLPLLGSAILKPDFHLSLRKAQVNCQL